MSAHASQAFSIAHCTDLEDLPISVLFVINAELFTVHLGSHIPQPDMLPLDYCRWLFVVIGFIQIIK